MLDYIRIDDALAVEIGLTPAITYAAILKTNTCDPKKLQEGILCLSEITIKRSIAKLRRLGYIDKAKLTPEQAKEMVLNKEPMYTCEWCNVKTHILHEHHYPIQKKDGGSDVVKICPNCHCAYHRFKGR